MTRCGRIAHTGVYKLLFYYHLIILLYIFKMHIREGVGNRPTRRTHNSLTHTHNTHTLPVDDDDDEIIVNRNRLFFFRHLTIQFIYYEIHLAAFPPHMSLRLYVHSNCVVPCVHRNISCAAAKNRPREEIPNVFIMQVIKTGCRRRRRGARASRSRQTEPFIFFLQIRLTIIK